MVVTTTVRVGVGIGGTFTDIVLFAEDGSIVTQKLLTTPDGYSRAMVDGTVGLLDRQSLPPEELREIVHGTTVATNAVLEHSGAPTGLITTQGFRDVLELRRIRSPELYNLGGR